MQLQDYPFIALLEFLAIVSIIGIFSCVSVLFKHSKRGVQQLDRIIGLLEEINGSPEPQEK